MTMDNLMKLVTTALEWSYQADEQDVKAERLELAASLLVLRHDTLRIIDGAGPAVEAPAPQSAEQGHESGTEEISAEQGQEAPEAKGANATKCRFSRVVVLIELQRFLESGIRLVECPECQATRTLEPHGGVLRAVVSRQTQNDDSQYRTTMGQD